MPYFTKNFDESSAWKVAKYGVISGPYFPVFSPNTEKCGPQKTAENITIVENSNIDIDLVCLHEETGNSWGSGIKNIFLPNVPKQIMGKIKTVHNANIHRILVLLKIGG